MKTAFFLLTSPFQIICGIEAKEYFKIKKSLFLFVTNPNTENSHQMISLGEKYGLRYEVLDYTKIKSGLKSFFFEYLTKFILRFRIFRYDYVFIGDPRERILQGFGASCLKKGGKLVYLDDGNISLVLLSSRQEVSNKYKKFKSLIKFWTGDKEWYFTIYHGISTTSYRIIPNEFNSLRQELSNQKLNDSIFILGTPVSIFCAYYGLSIHEYKKAYEHLLNFLIASYPQKRIFYIPHRRENCEETQDIKLKFGINIKSLHGPIEKYLIENREIPSIVCGFGTSALYNLNLLFPKIIIYNVAFRQCTDKEHFKEIELIYDYYEKNQINNLNFYN